MEKLRQLTSHVIWYFQKAMYLHLEFTNSTCFHQASFNSINLKNEKKSNTNSQTEKVISFPLLDGF